MKLDIIIPLKTSLIPLVIKLTIPQIFKNLSYNRIYIITHKNNFNKLQSTFGNTINCLDEDKICNNLTLHQIKKYLQKRDANVDRAGWYFQQFLKLNVSKLNYISESYLIWDADAVPLKPINFFAQDKKVYLEKNTEHHKPYFDIIEKLIGIKKQVNYSFISEYLVFKKKIVTSLITKISTKQDWWFDVLDKIDLENLSKSGFSEYELYGNYVSKYYPNHYKTRNLYKSRKGNKYLNKEYKNLYLFAFVFDYISFEESHKKYKPLLFRYLKIIFILFKVGIQRIISQKRQIL